MDQSIMRIRSSTLTRVERGLRPPSSLEINFNFYIELTTLDFDIDRDSATILRMRRGPSSEYVASAAVKMVAGPLSCDDQVREAVGKALADSLPDIERWNVIEIVLREVREKLDDSLPESGAFDVDLKLRVESCNYYAVRRDDDHERHRMVPATDSSMGLLDKCEDVESGMSCCICMEDFGGGGASRMPCSHVFHGDCIHQWLKTSHYCPLCRYQMPT